MRRHIGTGWGMPWTVVRSVGGGKGTAGLWDGSGITGTCVGLRDSDDRAAYFYSGRRGCPPGHRGEGD